VPGAFPQTPAFEVATVKLSDPATHMRSIRRVPGGRLTVTGMPLKDLITFAYDVKSSQVTGGPGWVETELYDINAKAEGNPDADQLKAMLKNLLAERFQVTIHREQKEFSIYALIPGKAGKAAAPNLAESKVADCPANGPPPAAPKPGELPCGGIRMSRNQMNATGVTMVQFVNALSNILGRVVIDKSGIPGKYDIKLEWTPDEGQPALGPGPAPAPPPADTAGPSIYTAVQEQLGLKLDSQKAPLDVLVIDNAAKPSDN
jgi:uncharacterized protein (TIGR03435 family)